MWILLYVLYVVLMCDCVVFYSLYFDEVIVCCDVNDDCMIFCMMLLLCELMIVIGELLVNYDEVGLDGVFVCLIVDWIVCM